MKHLYLLLFILGLSSFTLFAQDPKIDHWEVVIDVNSSLKFQVITGAPETNWNKLDYDDANWLESPLNGIGYGGLFNYLGLPAWTFEKPTTLYTRFEFTIIDTNAIESLMLDMYYEDGFVAYINGVEVARANIGNPGETVNFDQFADTTHTNNADIFSGYFSPGFIVDKSVLQQVLIDGTNVLAVELHNDAYVTNAHNCFSWLLAGLNIPDQQYLGNAYYLPIAVKFDTSNLPIVKINTEMETAITDEPKLDAHLQIIFDENASFNSVTSTIYDFDGAIGIEIRGSSSQQYPKKSYGFETRDSLGENLDVSLLGMPEEHDWILYAPYSDKTFLRDVLTYNLATSLGHYAPRTQFVELVLNDRLIGVYVLTEKIKRGKNRVSIANLNANEIAGDSLTGGYILKIDKMEGAYGGWRSEFGSAQSEFYKNYYQYSYPRFDEIVPEQKTYIQDFMSQFEHALRDGNFEDTAVGYRKYISVKSFIDYFIMNELTKNMDGYRISTFMYKDRDDKGGKLHMGPVWDYNLAFGNYEAFGGTLTNGWAMDFGKINPGDAYQLPFWWDRLLQDATFVTQLQERWVELRSTTLQKDSIFNRIDSMVDYTTEARIRNYSVWQGLFTEWIWPNNPFAEDYEGEIDYLKTWISDRLDWVDANISEVREKVDYVSIGSGRQGEYLAVSAYPNPFNETIQITLELEASHHVGIAIYNSLGQKVVQLANDDFTQGIQKFHWNGNGMDGAFMKPGIFIYKVSIDQKLTFTGKIMKQ